MKRFALVLATACVATSAAAADLPSRYSPPPYYDPVPVFAWGGVYAGLNAAFAFGNFDTGLPFGSPVGGFGGGTIGYNYQSGKLLVGVEADLDGGSFSDGRNFGLVNGNGSISVMGTARARVGYIWDRALIYATAGYAGTSANGRIGDFRGAPNLLMSESHYLNGYAVGAGVEYAITTKITAKAEYLFNGFGSSGYFVGTRDGRSVGANVNLLRVGVNYHF